MIFTRADTGIKTLADLRGRSFLFGLADSTLTSWAKIHLVEAGIRARDLSKYRCVDNDVDLPRNASSGTRAADLGNPFSEMTPVQAVLDGIYDAAVVTEQRFVQVAAKHRLTMLERFPDTDPLLVGQSQLPASAATTFQHAMTSLRDPLILQAFRSHPSGFELCTDKNFSDLREKLAVESLFDEN